MSEENRFIKGHRSASYLLRSRERGLLLLVTLLLTGMLFVLYNNINGDFATATNAVKQGKAIRLSGSTSRQQLSDLLYNGHYLAGKADADLVAGLITDKLRNKKQLGNLGELNKKDFWIPASQIDISGATGLQKRLLRERNRLGRDGMPPASRMTGIRLFDGNTYQQLKRNNILIVRTPEEFKTQFLFCTALFFSIFWLIHIIWTIARYTGDFVILPVVMVLCGFNLVMMYAIPDPLTDTVRGLQMSLGIAFGATLLFAFSWLDVQRFYASPDFNLPVAGSLLRKLHRKGKLPASLVFSQQTYRQPGFLYIILAFCMAIWLMVAGHGPDGSDGVKVNVSLAGINFEPAEIVKYLMVIFFATYFSRNSDFLREMPNLKWRIWNSSKIFAFFAFLLLMYLYLGDMGPALVLCGTFLIFYAVARGELKEMIIGVFFYTVALKAGYSLAGGGAAILLLITLAYFVFWILYGFIRKRWHESPFLIVFVIASFVFGGYLSYAPGPLAKVGKRLEERNDMFTHIWNNESHGGDQVANGIWSLASGGLLGQGVGKGDPKMTPACHTDMILASLGEELGLAGILIVFALIGILLRRSLFIARKAGNPFLFYLSGGIAVVTGIQFLIIAAGSIGALPLTGVSVPFLSFGRTGIIAQLAASGIVMAISSKPGMQLQQEYIYKHYHNIIRFGQWAFSSAMVVLSGFLICYMILGRDKYLVRPAFAVDKLGARTMNYNPRIQLLIDHLSAGNIYDRNGLLLATSNKDSVIRQEALLKTAGISDSSLTELKATWKQRYYPFGNNLYFWTGDYNDPLLRGNPRDGYFAEVRHLSLLRGFDTRHGMEKDSVVARSYKEPGGRLVHDSVFVFNLSNYAVLLPLLKAGRTSDRVRAFMHQDRSIRLTVDADLQTALQTAMQADPDMKKTRNGIVVLNPANGEVLAAAVNPLPDMEMLHSFYRLGRGEQLSVANRGKMNGENFVNADLALCNPTAPGSTAKIITALAAMNKAGQKAAAISYYIFREETIHKSAEPCNESVNMDMAITKSSNVFFIRLANELVLDNEMIAIYQAAGLNVLGIGGYSFYNTYSASRADSNKRLWIDRVFMPERDSYRRNIGSPKRYKNNYFSGLAWGQGELTATPLAMARVAGAIANKGEMQLSRFVINDDNSNGLPAGGLIRLTGASYAATLEGFMQHLTASKEIGKMTGTPVSSKTGTPERMIGLHTREFNDAWYVFFTYSPKLKGPIAVCIRREHVQLSSSIAIELAKKVVVPVLQSRNYLAYSQ